ncbi:MAG TPA: aspartyl/asparaginyl beta-hydroxylase domain-containing protein [Coleofasciculaceae cyanobacterium]|jgi:beta-hydroxylase
MPGFYNANDFKIASILEQNWQVIKHELTQLKEKDFLPWPEEYLYGKGWDTFGLYAFGVKIWKNCKLCPETTKLIETIPNLTTAGFSSLAPSTHIAPHTGYPDGLLRCHLGLSIPQGCGIRVGTETRHWEEGKCLIFDDTLEHEAWNKGTSTRVVLLIDFTAPEGLLTLPERKPGKGLSSLLGFFKEKKS